MSETIKVCLVGCKSYSVRNPSPTANAPLMYKQVGPTGERIVYEVSKALGAYLLDQKTDRGASYFKEASDIAAGDAPEKAAVPFPVEGAAPVSETPPAGISMSLPPATGTVENADSDSEEESVGV